MLINVPQGSNNHFDPGMVGKKLKDIEERYMHAVNGHRIAWFQMLDDIKYTMFFSAVKYCAFMMVVNGWELPEDDPVNEW